MNDTIKVMENHRSVRDYTNEPVSDEMLDMIINAAQHVPTSNNGQGISIIVIKDKKAREKMSELSRG